MKTRKIKTTVTRPSKHPKPAALLAALAALTLAGPTLTQARTGDRLESASPITVIGRDQIESTPNISRDIRDFTRLQPGIVTEGYGAGSYGTANNGSNISLRGINTNTRFNNTYYGGITHVPTGLYVDPSQLERVEVLRGPQGTLYGRNASTGTINLNTRYSDRTDPVETTDTVEPYSMGVGYRYNDIKFNPGVNYDPNALGTGRINAGLNNGQTEPAYTPDLTVGQNWNTGRLNPEINYEPTEWKPNLNTAGPGLNTTLNTTPTTPETTTGTTEPTHTPANSTTGTVETTANTPSYTPAYDYGSYNNPCPKVNGHEINNRIANILRRDSAYLATGLLLNSQEPRFFDYNYYNTATDELANREIIGNQLAQGLSVTNGADNFGQGLANGCHRADPIMENTPYVPKIYYRVAGGDFTPTTTITNDDSASGTGTTRTELPPIPEYKPTVPPINARELSDRQLAGEISSGPGLIRHYLDEAAGLREDAAGYRERAEQWRKDAARARANAEESRKKAKKAKTEDSRKFHEDQAETYDDLSDILEDSASGLDRSAANDEAAATSYEADAAQSATNYGQAVAEQAQRQTVEAARAAQAQAAREAEAARVDAERQAALQELIRRSQQSSQNNTGNQPNNSSGPRRSYHPDGHVPRPGREPRNETIRKLLD